jgi:hypothetical protein
MILVSRAEAEINKEGYATIRFKIGNNTYHCAVYANFTLEIFSPNNDLEILETKPYSIGVSK